MTYATDPQAYESLLADIAAGTRLHYDNQASADPDLDLLTGDERYADGLVKLAALGDLQATRILGDAISEIARARAAGDVASAHSAWERAVQAVRTER
jgi:hypothetical protein